MCMPLLPTVDCVTSPMSTVDIWVHRFLLENSGYTDETDSGLIWIFCTSKQTFLSLSLFVFFYQCSSPLCIYPTVSQLNTRILKPKHLIPPPSPWLPFLSFHSGVDTWSPLWVMYHAHLNGLARLTDNNPLCFGLLCETLKSNLLADLSSRPAIGPPTSLPWWIVIVIEWLGARPLTVGGWEISDFIELGFTKGKWKRELLC